MNETIERENRPNQDGESNQYKYDASGHSRAGALDRRPRRRTPIPARTTPSASDNRPTSIRPPNPWLGSTWRTAKVRIKTTALNDRQTAPRLRDVPASIERILLSGEYGLNMEEKAGIRTSLAVW